MKKTTGGAFLVIGTSVGAGILSLPLITAACGLGVAIVLTIISWSVMYVMSLKLLKLCSQHELGVNFTTLLSHKVPPVIQVAFTIVYLLLLYSLMAAYTTQGASLIDVVTGRGFPSIVPVDALIFILVFGFIIISYRLSDYINRSFISIKIFFFILCAISMLAFLSWSHAAALPLSIYAISMAWPTLLPAFGFQNIVPVLYEYQKGDIKAIKRSILVGSLFVLVLYIAWITVCLAIIPQTGTDSYQTIFTHGNTLNEFIQVITAHTQSRWIHTFLTIFINISIVTSFICVGVSLFHYIKDIFKRFNMALNNLLGLFLTFLAPFVFTIFYPKGFILALQYASIFAVIVFVFTPMFLDKETRYHKINLYPLILGILVIVAQLLNLTGGATPF